VIPGSVEAGELRTRALLEADELGPEPIGSDRDLWLENAAAPSFSYPGSMASVGELIDRDLARDVSKAARRNLETRAGNRRYLVRALLRAARAIVDFLGTQGMYPGIL
jgi:hypothetical protein